MRTSREKSSLGGVSSGAERACGQTPAMEEGTGVNPGYSPGGSVLNSPSLRSLVGEECLQMLRCGICMEFFSIPIVLPCGHTFCLQCLTDMCKQATHPRGPSPVVTDVLIGCPNCRVQIFATPILQRNVTCNFIIQSLIDILRNRKLPKKTDVSVNTERSLLGPPVRAVSEEVLCGVLRDFDRLTSSLGHRSVVDDAFFEIETIRSNHRADTDRASGDALDAKRDVPSSTHTVNHPCHFAASLSATSQPSSLTTVNTDSTSQNHYSTGAQQQTSTRCYAAALASGKSRSVTPFTANSGVVDANTRPDTQAHPVPRTLPVSTCGARSIPVLTASHRSGHNSMCTVRDKNRNNTEMLHEVTGLKADNEYSQSGLVVRLSSSKLSLEFTPAQHRMRTK